MTPNPRSSKHEFLTAPYRLLTHSLSWNVAMLYAYHSAANLSPSRTVGSSVRNQPMYMVLPLRMLSVPTMLPPSSSPPALKQAPPAAVKRPCLRGTGALVARGSEAAIQRRLPFDRLRLYDGEGRRDRRQPASSVWPAREPQRVKTYRPTRLWQSSRHRVSRSAVSRCCC